MGKKTGLGVKEMKASIQSTMADLGVTISFDADKSLRNYVPGPTLTLKELRALPEGAVVWAWYKEHGEDGPRIDGPQRIWKSGTEDGTWDLEDGSSFGASFTPTGDYRPELGGFTTPPEDSECFDESGGEGIMKLYHALSKPKKKTIEHIRKSIEKRTKLVQERFAKRAKKARKRV
jgi:hypothetical protein